MTHNPHQITIPTNWTPPRYSLGQQTTQGEYQVSQFSDNDRLISPTLSELNLTAQQIFDAATFMGAN